METNDIDRIRDDLSRLLETFTRNSKVIMENFADTSDNVPDPIDRASLQSEMDFTFNMRSREGLNKDNLLRALRKLDEGSYGICESCEEEIPIKRLKAIPGAKCCISCQMRLEKEMALISIG